MSTRTYNKLVYKALEVFNDALLELHEKTDVGDIAMSWRKKIVKIHRALVIFENKRKEPYMSESFKPLADNYFKKFKDLKDSHYQSIE